MAALQELILRVDLFYFSNRVFSDDVFHHNGIARLCNCKIRFGSDDQPERLEFGRNVELALGAVQDDFTQIGRPALGRDGPHYISKELGTEPGCRLQVVEFNFDFDVSLFALDLGFAPGFWH